MTAKRFSEIRRSGKTVAERYRQEAKEDVRAATLMELRKAEGNVVQIEMAKRLGISQVEVSRAELRADHRISTLRRYVEALGGDLEVLARMKGGVYRLKGV